MHLAISNVLSFPPWTMTISASGMAAATLRMTFSMHFSSFQQETIMLTVGDAGMEGVEKRLLLPLVWDMASGNFVSEPGGRKLVFLGRHRLGQLLRKGWPRPGTPCGSDSFNSPNCWTKLPRRRRTGLRPRRK